MASKKNKKYSNSFLFVLIGLMIVLLGAMFFFNDIMIEVRLTELKFFLKNINRAESNYDFIFMVSKFRTNKKLYEDKITEADAQKQEFNNLLFLKFEDDNSVDVERYQVLSKPVISIINGFRIIFQQPLMQFKFEDKSNKYLDIAYYYERNKQYKKAIEIYDDAYEYEATSGKTKIPIILLHKGYCNAIIGQYNEAREIFLDIINNYQDEQVTITAAMLLKLIEDFHKEIERVKNLDVDPLLKSEKLIKLIAYDDAMDVLETIDPGETEDGDKIKYFKARIFEETGNTTDAVKEYQKLITENPESEFAKVSNKRILLISTESDKKEELTTLAEKNNELIQDDTFEEYLDKSVRINSDMYRLKRLKEDVEIEEEVTIFDEPEDETETIESFIEETTKVVEEKVEVKKQEKIIKEKEEKEAEENKIELERIEREKKEREKKELERKEKERRERIKKDRLERQRKEREKRERERKERERIAREKKEREEKERKEKERLEKEEAEKEKIIVEIRKKNPKSKTDKSRTVYYRNAETNDVIKAEMYGVNGQLEKTYIYEYDEKGNQFVKIYDGDGNLLE